MALTVALAVAAAVAGLLAYGWFEAGWVRLRELHVVVPNLPAELHGLRIAHLSDFHLGLPSRGVRAVERAVAWVAAEQPDLTLSKTTERFLHTIDPDERAQVHGDLQRFVRWYGGERTLDELRPADLEAYSSSVTTSAVNGRRHLSALRTFLAYAKRAGLMDENLSVHVRIARTAERSKAASAPSNGPVLRLTPEGFAQLEQELETLRGHRPRMAQEMRLAMADKDFRENAPLDAAREEQAHLEARIREIEQTLQRSVVMQPEERTDVGSARIGTIVRLHDLTSGRDIRFTLVERTEVDLSQGKLSVESPVGRALLGRAPGEQIDVDAPSGRRTYRLDAIEAG